jgi:hypothetical protein
MKKFCLLYLCLFFLCAYSPYALAEEVLSWEDCLAEAGKNHPDLISAQQAIKQKEADKAISKSGLFPQIGAGKAGF